MTTIKNLFEFILKEENEFGKFGKFGYKKGVCALYPFIRYGYDCFMDAYNIFIYELDEFHYIKVR